jgi:hypothetical protein
MYPGKTVSLRNYFCEEGLENCSDGPYIMVLTCPIDSAGRVGINPQNRV